MASGDGSGAGRPAAQPEERKTETTLTTRIRINIPGSRPIPPVVMRTPVGDGEGAADDKPAAPAEPRPASAGATPTGTVEPPAGSTAPKAEDKPASDWFAPRKSGAPKGGPAAGGTNGAGAGGSSAGAAGSAGARQNGSGAAATKGGPGGSDASGAPGATGARPAGRPGGVVGAMSVPGGSRPGAPKGSGLPSATGGPVAPGHGGGTGSFDVTEALAAGPLGTPRPGANDGEPSRDDLPYFSDTGRHDLGAPGAPGAGVGGPGGPSGFSGPNGTGGPGGPQGPAGPTGGPVTGDGLLSPQAGGPGLVGGEPFGANGQGGVPRSALSDLDRPTAQAGPGAVPGAGLGPGGGLSDDTAILTPQKPAPESGVPGYPAPDNVSGHTVTSGMPVIPTAGNAPFGPGGPEGPAAPATPRPEGAAQPKAQARTKKKGRSKLVLLGVGVVVVLGGAYGAGLLMNHTDVPKGTTVLGTDIGGGTRDDAVKKLDDAFGSRVNKPLKLSVGGKTVSLAPDNAGLQFDFQATVSQAATSDYNPVSVIGSLFGQSREIEPVMPVDEEKLQAALQQTGGGSGSVTEGGVEFVSGKAVPVYGKAGKAVDAAQSTQAVEQAYRTLVETGTASAVSVPMTTQEPKVSNAEVDREMKAFAEPAMSGNVIVRTDATHFIKFSPQNSLWKFLRVTAVNGKLVDSPDLNALKGLYGQTFEGVLITRGTGKKTAVTPQDVYVALRQALLSTTHRDVVMDTNPS